MDEKNCKTYANLITSYMGKLWLNNDLVEHRKAYYALKYVNYDLLNPQNINFMIPQSQMEAWKADYAEMRRFFIYGKSLEFDALTQRIEELHTRVRNL